MGDTAHFILFVFAKFSGPDFSKCYVILKNNNINGWIKIPRLGKKKKKGKKQTKPPCG